MDGKRKQYRERLDKTLACHDLVEEGALRELVRDHLRKSLQHESEAEIQSFVEYRTQMISSFLEMLRSASGKEPVTSMPKIHETSREWKVKEDNEDFRIMYREGAPGTPFHDLRPIDVFGYHIYSLNSDVIFISALCVASEAPLYKYWWPHYNIPTFNVISDECLHHIWIGECIASVKAKVAWPISSREVLIHYVEFEYFQEDLIIVVINSISGPDDIEGSLHGIAKEMIPAEENGMVRIGITGGLALQKVTSCRTYFRTMGSMDLKLSYVPSWLINFMARQLLGSGFKLYKNAVSSWTNNGNENFQRALDGPLYARIHSALLSENKLNAEKIIVPEGNSRSSENESNEGTDY